MGWFKKLFIGETIGDVIRNKKIPYKSETVFIVRGLSFVTVCSYLVNGVKYFQAHIVFDDATDMISDYFINLDTCLNYGIKKLKRHQYPWGGTMDISTGHIKYTKPFEPVNYN